MRLLPGLLVVLLAACAAAAVASVGPRDTASPQALAYFERMMRAHDSTGVEQAACVTHWTYVMRDGTAVMRVERVAPAVAIMSATLDGVAFMCGARDGTVHTHSFVCVPSEVDLVGDEAFGVVVCPRPTRFVVFPVTSAPKRAP